MEYVKLTSPEGGVPVPQAAMDVSSCVTWCSDVTPCQAVMYNDHSATCTVYDALPTVTVTNPCCQLYRKRTTPCNNSNVSNDKMRSKPREDIDTKKGLGMSKNYLVKNGRAVNGGTDKGSDSGRDSSAKYDLKPVELGTEFSDSSDVLSEPARLRLDDQNRWARGVNLTSRLTKEEARLNSADSQENTRSTETQATTGSSNSSKEVSKSAVETFSTGKPTGKVTLDFTDSYSTTTHLPILKETPSLNENGISADSPKTKLSEKLDLLKEKEEEGEEHGSWSFDEDDDLTSEEMAQRLSKVEIPDPFEEHNHTSSHQNMFSQDITQKELRKIVAPPSAGLENFEPVTSVTIDLDADAPNSVTSILETKLTDTGDTMGTTIAPIITISQAMASTESSKSDSSSPMSTIVIAEDQGVTKSGHTSVEREEIRGRENSAESIIAAEPYCKQNVTIMQLQGRTNQPGGAHIGRSLTSEQCLAWCLENYYCVSVDYNLWDRSCWWHGTPGHTQNSTCCTHHIKLHTCTYDCFDIYYGYMLNSTSSSSTLNVTVEECRSLCTQEENCTGYDYCNLTSSCRLVLEDITTTVNERIERNSSLYAIRKDCYGSPADVHIIIGTTTMLPTFPDFTFPSLPSTSPRDIDDVEAASADGHFLLSPAALIVLGGCSLVLTVGGATMVGYILHRRREKRLLRGDPHHHPAVWMNDYPAAHYTTRGLSYWYADGPPGVIAVNPAFNQHDEFPVGRTAAEFGLGRGLAEDSNSRGRRTLSSGVSRSRSFGDSPYGIQHASYPTFPLRQLRVSVPSTSIGSGPSPRNSPTTPSTHAHANYPAHFGEYHAGGHIDGRRLPRYELGMAHDDELRCAYP